MTLPRLAFPLAWLTAVATFGCGDDGSSSSGAAETNTESASSAGPTTFDSYDPPEESTGFELVCIPGTQRCGNQVTVETCAATGLEWVPEPCGPMATCIPCEEVDCTTARCGGPCDVAADLPSSAGCNFIADRNLHLYPQFPDGVVLGNPNEEGTADVKIYQVPEGKRDEELLQELTLAPGEVSDPIELSNEFLPCCQSFLRTGGIFRIRSNLPIIAYQHSPLQANLGNESSLLLPDEVLGTDYVVASSPESFACGTNPPVCYQGPSYFTVVALEDDTHVTWTPRVSATNGNGIPIPLVEVGQTDGLTMNRYETVRIVPSENFIDTDTPDYNLSLDVSGTIVQSDKPIWVIAGSRVTTVPFEGLGNPDDGTINQYGTADQIQEVMFPLNTWGKKYVAPAPPQRCPPTPMICDEGSNEKSYWRIFAGSAGVTVTSDPPHPSFPVTLQERGEFIDVTVDHGVNMIFEGDGAFLPVQYMRARILNSTLATVLGDDNNIQRGDAAMVQMVPTEQFLQRYAFATGIGFGYNFVQVIRTQGGADVLLDDDPVTGFAAVGAEFEVASVPIEEGSHEIVSDDPIGIIQMGWTRGLPPGEDPGCVRTEEIEVDGEVLLPTDCNATYAYPGGLKTEPIFIP